MGFINLSFNGLKKNIFHALNYFFFVSWFMYFINFNVEATLVEKIIVFFLMYKCTVYLYKTYLESNVNKIYSALFEKNAEKKINQELHELNESESNQESQEIKESNKSEPKQESQEINKSNETEPKQELQEIKESNTSEPKQESIKE